MKKIHLLALILTVCVSVTAGCYEEDTNLSPLAMLGDIGSDPGADPVDPEDPIDPPVPGYAGPASVIATDGEHADRIGVNWEPVEDAVSYNIYRAGSEGGPYDTIGTVSAEDLVPDPADPPVDPPVTPPSEPTVLQAAFQSDVDLNQKYVLRILFIPVATYYGVYVEASNTYQIRIRLGTTIHKLVTFTGGLGGEYYTRDDVIAKFNAAAGKTICHAVDDGNGQYIRIVSTDGAITLENNWEFGMITLYPPLQKFLKQDAGWSTVIHVDPVEVGGETPPDPEPGPDPEPELSYYFTDTDVTPGAQYFYVITAVNPAGVESEYSPADGGYAILDSMPEKVTGVSASDGTLSDRVTVTWNAADRATFYRVFRTRGSSMVQVGGDVTGTSLDDTTAAPGLYSYRVVSCNDEATGPESAGDTGYRAITNLEFFGEVYKEEESGMNRLTLIKKSGTGKLGEETIQDLAGNGTLYYKASGGLSSASVLLRFTNFSDFYLTLTGEQTTTVRDPLGTPNGPITGTLNAAGLYNGYVRFDLTLTGETVTGGNYYVSQDGGPETAIPYTYTP